MKAEIQRRTFIKGCAAVSLMPMLSNPLLAAVWNESNGTDFNIVSFGAVGDAATDCTAAIQQAIQACHQAGGGRVIIPEGKFLSGSLELFSHVNLHFQDEAELIFNANTSSVSTAMIRASQQQQIAITGHGTLDAKANQPGWWYGMGYQPDTQQTNVLAAVLDITDCQNVAFEDVSIRNAPAWLIRPKQSQRVEISNVICV
ncbi:glycosyl hydrolase family 28-related protein [Gynuella sunshinyii]|uniref:Endopolygalacturonase n=1 Tax=Gynuella sunshinyii YC6258 TaxID=1445510 RepID=A0A0C5V5S5_9GAMM|nr:glycosyl hydrolase family 28-related protein [Gynuella sunshinyii]AJQ94780.1 endopolygalacturonase [Gynuella sunshinyii YC6258]